MSNTSNLAEGIFSYSVDFVLWTVVYLAGVATPQPRSGSFLRAAIEADTALKEINYLVIKNALSTARKKDYIRFHKRGAMPEVTEAGLERLRKIIPKYDSTRTWDRRIHLVTYDIPENKKKYRDTLRRYLVRIGCGKLQDSVWMTPYNPLDILRDFIHEKRLEGTIIVSNLGSDASIGEETRLDLLTRVYALKQLNERYKTWLTMYDTRKAVDSYLLLSYLAILKDDPQLPFTLLPNWWKGDIAYQKVASYIRERL